MKTKYDLLEIVNKINYKKIAFYCGFIFLIILGRVIYLDSDLPTNFTLLDLYPIDEGYYTHSAFNLYNYGNLNHNVLPYVLGDSGIANLFQTILTYISLLIFGNNYYGVRIPSVFISLITIWLLYLILKNIKEDNSKFTNYSIFFMILYFLTDFQYLSISRIYVPTVFRIFFITLMVYIFSRFYKKTYKEIFTYKNIFILSFLSMSSIFFIYIYNIFIYSATVFTIFLVSLINNWKTDKKQIIKDTSWVILGSISSLILFIIYLKFAYNISLIGYYNKIFTEHFSNRVILSSNVIGFRNWSYLFIKNTIKAFYQDLSTNIFRFNISFLLLFLIYLPFFIYKTVKKLNIFNIYILTILVFLFLQTIFENSYFHRRLTVILPIIIIIISMNLFNNFIEKKYSHIFYSYIVLITTLISYIFYKDNIMGRDIGGLTAFKSDKFDGTLNQVYIYISILFFILILFLVLISFIKPKLNTFKLKIIIMIFLIIPNINLIFSFTYNSPEFNNRNTMIEISQKIKNEIVIGQISFSLRFYNDFKPVLNPYLYYPSRFKEYASNISKILKNKKARYILQFFKVKNPLFKIKNKKGSKIKLVVENVYYWGNDLFIILYKAVFINEEKEGNIIYNK